MMQRQFSYFGRFVCCGLVAFIYGILLFVAAQPVAAQEPIAFMLKDIANPATSFPTASSNPHHFMAVGDKLYFVTEVDARFSLWVTDGAAANTRFVADFPLLDGGPRTVEPNEMVPLGDHLFYLLLESFYSVLWHSDGTSAGTYKIEYTGILLQKPVAVGDVLYFATVTNNTPIGTLWKVDASQTKAVQVRQFTSPVDGLLSLSSLTDFNGTLMFVCKCGSEHSELWRSDGTESGTQQVLEFEADLRDLTVVGSQLYLTHFSLATGATELWVSDGAAAGTHKLTVGNPVITPPNSVFQSFLVTPLNDLAYFVATGQFGLPHVWRSDGTDAGTSEAFQIIIDGVLVRPATLTASAQALYFLAEYDQPTPPWQLWQSDGTEAGSLLMDAEVAALVAVGDGTACYTYVQNTLTCQNAAGQKVMLDSAFGLNFGNYQSPGALMAFFKGKFYFGGNDDVAGVELMSFDPQSKQIALVKDLNRTRLAADQLNSDSSPDNLTATGGYVYFTAQNVLGVRQLWRTDGTTAGTLRVGNLGFDSISTMTAVSETLYLAGRTRGQLDGMTLWRTDESGLNIVEIVTFDFGDITYMAAVGDKLYFAVNNSDFQGLWQSDGTPSGTTLLKSFVFPAIAPKELTVVNDKLYFIAEEVLERQELWTSNGTAQGTIRVKELAPLGERTRIINLTIMNNRLYFLASTVSRAECSGGTSELNELWRSDGTDAGTSMLINFDCATEAEWPAALTAVGDHLYMMMRPLWSGHAFYTLWRTDGNGAKLELIQDGDPPFSSLPDDVRRLTIESVNGADYYYGPSQVNSNVTSLYAVDSSGNVHVAFEPDTPDDGYTTSGG
ncbi:MAG: hypothetical protein R3A44_09185 [Caldilineaceae bacterium]